MHYICVQITYFHCNMQKLSGTRNIWDWLIQINQKNVNFIVKRIFLVWRFSLEIKVQIKGQISWYQNSFDQENLYFEIWDQNIWLESWKIRHYQIIEYDFLSTPLYLKFRFSHIYAKYHEKLGLGFSKPIHIFSEGFNFAFDFEISSPVPKGSFQFFLLMNIRVKC